MKVVHYAHMQTLFAQFLLYYRLYLKGALLFAFYFLGHQFMHNYNNNKSVFVFILANILQI